MLLPFFVYLFPFGMPPNRLMQLRIGSGGLDVCLVLCKLHLLLMFVLFHVCNADDLISLNFSLLAYAS